MSLYQLLAQGFNPGKGMVDASATNLAGQKMKYDMEQQALQNNLVQKRADQSNLWKMLNHQQKTAQSEANNKRQVFQLQQQALSKVETPQQFEAVKSMLAESGYPLPENITFDGVKQLASSNNATFGVTPQYALDSERNLVPYVLGNDGSTKLVGLPDNLTPVRPMKFMDLGDRRVGVNAYSGEESATHDKGLPPQDTVEHQENVTDAKERVKLRVKKKAAMPKDRKGITAYRRKAERVRNFLNEARSLTNAFTAGYGAIFSKWPASAQRRLNNVLDSIRANIGFSELQDMRNNSPTGGALGQVSERELHLLNSVLGSLDQWQSPEDLMKVYDDIDGRFDTGLVDMENAFNEHYADIISGGSQKPNDQADNDPLGLR